MSVPEVPAPDELVISVEAPEPVRDDLGLEFTIESDVDVAHPLVTIGDSLTHGFQNLAVRNTDRSWPALLAEAMGVTPFRYPVYPGPDGCAGLPLNMEELLRHADTITKGRPLPAHALRLIVALYTQARGVQRYWGFGPGRLPVEQAEFNHNLAIYGWDVRDALSKNVGWCQEQLAERPARRSWNPRRLLVQNDGPIAALRALAGPGDPGTTQLTAARQLGAEGVGTLVVALGANNALSSVLRLRLVWSGDNFADLNGKKAYTVWRPAHFQQEYDQLVTEIEKVGARHVVLVTVPHVTVAPLARGVGDKPEGSRYFARYTYAWISDDQFDTADPCLTGTQCRQIDSAIDMYNQVIIEHVRAHRQAGDDWRVFDLCALLDRLAYRRYLDDPTTRPSWWNRYGPYPLPQALRELHPRPDTRFFLSDARGRTQGGLIALDGVHPTSIGYGIMASEMLAILARANVPGAVGATIDFADLLRRDTLVSNPPASLGGDFRTLGWLQHRLQLFAALTELW
ncbi:hypothetical protein ThrDRAFT_00015 [Frankia casuarinae]|uniref:Uncharacterized protein n=1 Tax=Frankia casuarinae (strain DSM 45818 / CECT 9043 / HFP020203 / CcI3) TaxID=106370 RepID=Q2JGU1_FRACC|nr:MULTISPECIES: hypothetical protein [Frankia]ABD09501.1 hypothetical protein Francci3_0107 [Frankia casuarinae]EYT94092.1 hypothetical protein ThrDRAFT_00015 [Frankia casuarinae]KDA44282.1 hypothetical protein BMG523Draft_00780 [Frankia sp. BMG5.23]KEZ35911.1 hypothetical protein CEDDRAFT_02767 [Frankia sp. CeD]